jgi:hexosaminidase
VDVVKQYIDYLTAYKMNVLHLHLSDDQGWRIEIKSWPNLTAHGSKTQVGGGKGGYFTQEEFVELIQYAKERYITIIPEIDMPGHTNAALASYPELNETAKAQELYTGTEVGFSTLDTQKEITYQFVDDVIRELSGLISGDYIHIGGDESHVTKKEDYLYFMNRVRAIVKSYGKKSIGWDEIATSTMLPGTIAQYWSSVENAQLAIGQGAKILLSPSSRVYLDMKYDSTTILGLTWAGIIEVDKAYNWELSDLIPDIDDENIVGIEAPLWTETAETLADIQFLVFPRLLGVAEIGWSPASVRNWETYKIRLAKQKGWFEKMNINYYKSPLVPWESN